MFRLLNQGKDEVSNTTANLQHSQLLLFILWEKLNNRKESGDARPCVSSLPQSNDVKILSHFAAKTIPSLSDDFTTPPATLHPLCVIFHSYSLMQLAKK